MHVSLRAQSTRLWTKTEAHLFRLYINRYFGIDQLLRQLVSKISAKMKTYSLAHKLCLEVLASRLIDYLKHSSRMCYASAAQAMLAMKQANGTLQCLILRVSALRLLRESGNAACKKIRHGSRMFWEQMQIMRWLYTER